MVDELQPRAAKPGLDRQSSQAEPSPIANFQKHKLDQCLLFEVTTFRSGLLCSKSSLMQSASISEKSLIHFFGVSVCHSSSVADLCGLCLYTALDQALGKR